MPAQGYKKHKCTYFFWLINKYLLISLIFLLIIQQSVIFNVDFAFYEGQNINNLIIIDIIIYIKVDSNRLIINLKKHLSQFIIFTSHCIYRRLSTHMWPKSSAHHCNFFLKKKLFTYETRPLTYSAATNNAWVILPR